MSTQTVNINGIDLVYEKEGSGPPVVFLHGGNSSGIEWEPVVPHLMATHTCFVLDQRGHGCSGRDPKVDYSVRAFADEAAEFLDKVPGRAVVVGHSQGGHAAFGAAAARPDLVRAIFSEDAIPSIGTPSHLSKGWPLRFFPALGELAARRKRAQMTLLEFAAGWGSISIGGRALFETVPPPGVIAAARASYGTDPEYYRFTADLERFGWDDSDVPRLTNVTCPVHLARGNPKLPAGGLISDEAFAEVEHLANWTTTYFENAGHNIQSAQPREFINDLKAFLERLPA